MTKAPASPQVTAFLKEKRGKLSVLERDAIAARRAHGDTVKELAEEFGVSISTIYKIQPHLY